MFSSASCRLLGLAKPLKYCLTCIPWKATVTPEYSRKFARPLPIRFLWIGVYAEINEAFSRSDRAESLRLFLVGQRTARLWCSHLAIGTQIIRCSVSSRWSLTPGEDWLPRCIDGRSSTARSEIHF